MLNYALIMFARIQALRLVPLFISNFQISGIAILCVMLPAHAAALQPAELPPFDSFSYLHDSVFAPERVRSKRMHGDAPSTMQFEADMAGPTSSPELTRSDPSGKMRLDELRELETRLAIDKALSQILKLTVDYGALRHQLASMAQSVEGADKNWYASEDSSTQAGQAIEQLQQLNQKQINDKDKVIALTKVQLDEVQARLDDIQLRLLASQKRYEQENAARLLAEENLTLARRSLEKNRANLKKRNTQVQKLEKQLKENKALVQELKIALGDETLKPGQQSESAAEAVVTDAGEVDAGNAAAEPVTRPTLAGNGSTDLASMPAVAEWLIEGLEFEEGSAEIRQQSATSLDMLITYLKQRQTLHIQVNGYTDSIGSAEYNLRLSQARAQAVADYLQVAGIAGHQIKVLGYGERRPIADNELEAGRVKNRRVTIMFLK